MKSLKSLALLTFIVLMIASCGPSRKEMIDNVTVLENEFSDQSQGINKTRATQLVDAYIEYAGSFPDDSLAPEYLFRGADISMNMYESGRAIDLYDKILSSYPNFRKAPQCIFLKAFVYENNLNDLVNAKRYYLEFLEKYPDDDFADDAQISLENLGKTPEELIKEFEEKMKETEAETTKE